MAAISTFTLPCLRLQCQTVVKSKTYIGSFQSFNLDKSMIHRFSIGSPKFKLRSQIGWLEDLSPSPSPVETIKHLYDCINKKNLKELGDLIAKDCFIDDFSFFAPFRGKKETIRFFEQLIGSMGRNVNFSLDLIICEKDSFTVAVIWHLEWRKQRIPLTRGCSFYECVTKESNIVIRKAHVLVESPIKAGALALGLLMTITSFFDAFPQATQWFLDKPYVITNIILKIYSLTLGPFISPFLKYYPKVFNFVTSFINFVLKILLFGSKIYPF